MPLGFFTAGSALVRLGRDVQFLDLSLQDDWPTALGTNLRASSPDAIGISVCSFVNYSLALDVIAWLASAGFDGPVFLGGQHIRRPVTVQKHRRGVIVLAGYAEGLRVQDLAPCSGGQIRRRTSELCPLDFSCLPDIGHYLPSTEIARGCWNRCGFCSSDHPYVVKNASTVRDELYQLATSFPAGTVLSLGGSNHRFREWPKTSILSVLMEFSRHFRYVFNIGVESGWQHVWSSLVKLDPWHVYVGLESGSPDTLLRMNKTSDPGNYLRTAKALLQRCSADDVYATATVIYGYPGDVKRDLDATDAIIYENASTNITFCGQPCHAYPGTELLTHREHYEKKLHARYRPFPGHEQSFFFNLDPSPDMSYDQLRHRSVKVFRSVNRNARTYYRCRAYRQYSRFQDFLANASQYEDFQPSEGRQQG